MQDTYIAAIEDQNKINFMFPVNDPLKKNNLLEQKPIPFVDPLTIINGYNYFSNFIIQFGIVE